MATTGLEPILASTIYLATTASPETLKIATGLMGLNETLGGGLAYGSMSCISAVSQDISARNFALQNMLEHLISIADVHAVATVIDTTLSFDVRGFHQRVVATLQAQNENVVDVNARSMAILGKIRIMKAFDFAGVVECVAELKGSLGHETGSIVAPRGTIDDSEDDEQDEILDGPLPPRQKIALPESHSLCPATSRGFLLIDNISQPALAQIKTDHVQGQSLLSTFLRSLRHLTITYQLATVLINNTDSNTRQSKEDGPSIFTSCSLRPSLGLSFAGSLDLHLLIHDVPRDEVSARAAYGEPRGRGECVSVAEVLQDRLEGNLGRWVAFESRDGGRIEQVP